MEKESALIGAENYRLLVKSIREYAIIMLDPTGHVISWNKGAEQLKGYTEKEILGKYISVFYTAQEIASDTPQLNLQKAKELGWFENEGWRVRKDGSIFWANVVFTAFKDDEGNLIGFGKVTRDITRRKKAEEQIKVLNTALEDQLLKSKSETLDYIHALDEAAIVAITDQKGIIKHVNENFCRISKYSKEELLGQDHRIINSGYHSREFIRDLWVTIANGKIWRGELNNRAKDGSYYWVDTTIVPFLNENGKPFQYLAIRSDITQRKLAEEEIYRINQDLEKKVTERTLELTAALEREKELNDLKSRFVSMASHEFRTPLSTILSSVSLIEKYKTTDTDDKRLKHVERIKYSVRNLAELLDNFLSLDKLEQGRVEVRNVLFDLHEFILNIIEELDGLLKKKLQKIIFDYNGPDEVCQDKKILHNVLLNLLSNAIKYSAEEKEIKIDARVMNDKIMISVKDEGIGIPLHLQQQIFSKYFRAENAINIQGTGLGLNIVKRYVELMEGVIYFTSKENEGTIFIVEIPLRLLE